MPSPGRLSLASLFRRAAILCTFLCSLSLVAQSGYQPSPAQPEVSRMVRAGSLWHVHPLGHLQSARRWRVGDAGAPSHRPAVRAAGCPVLPGEVRCRAVGLARPSRRACVTSSSPRVTTTASPCSRRSRTSTTSSTPRPTAKTFIRQLADECHRQDIKLFVYYSQLDWHHPDYYPLGGTGHWDGRPTNGQWPRYLDFMNAQLTELFTNYGEIGGIWFDGMWDKPDADWQLDRTYAVHPRAAARRAHRLQPSQAAIPRRGLSDLREGPCPATTPRDGAALQSASFRSKPTTPCIAADRGASTCAIWNPRSLRDLIQYMVRAAGNNANFLLNVGPQPNGEIQTAFADPPSRNGRLAEDLRRFHLRHARWSREAWRMGRHHAARQHHLCSRTRSLADSVLALPGIAKPIRDGPSAERWSQGEPPSLPKEASCSNFPNAPPTRSIRSSCSNWVLDRFAL